MRKIKCILLLVLVLCVLSGCCMSHEWDSATCSRAKTCVKCGEIQGTPLEHTWQAASCGVPETCSVCGGVRGDIPEHKWVEATCAEPRHCTACGLTEGEALAHTPEDAGQFLSRWLEEEQASAQVLVKICSVCEGEVWYHAVDDLPVGSWTCTSYTYKGKTQKMNPGDIFMILKDDGTHVFVENGNCGYAEWVNAGWNQVGNISDVDREVQEGRDVRWNRRVTATRADGKGYEIELLGEDPNTAKLTYGDSVYFFLRGRTVPQQEQQLMELLPGKWEWLGKIENGEISMGDGIQIQFNTDGTSKLLYTKDGQPVEQNFGPWQYTRSYTDQETGLPCIAFAVNSEPTKYYPFILYYSEEPQLEGVVKPGWCLRNTYSAGAEYYQKVD